MSSLFCSSHSSQALSGDRRGFVAIIVVLLIGFITVVAAGILWLFVEEGKASRLLSAGMTLQYGSEGAIEYALLKKKNHDHGFEDSMNRHESCSASAQIQSAAGNIPVMSQSLKVGYEMKSQVKSQTGTLKKYEYLVIPLYVDPGTGSSIPNCGDFKKTESAPTAFPFTKDFKLALTPGAADAGKVTWNILASRSASDTVGLVGTGGITDMNVIGKFRSTQGDVDGQRFVTDTDQKIVDFLGHVDTKKPFLILFNNQDGEVEYDLSSLAVGGVTHPFSSPRPCITATAELGAGVSRRGQFYEFCQNNADLLEGLKYSFFSF